jgi:hypothetical protein
MRDIGEKQFSKVASGDTKPNSWTLLDFGKSMLSCHVYPILALLISYCQLVLQDLIICFERKRNTIINWIKSTSLTL